MGAGSLSALPREAHTHPVGRLLPAPSPLSGGPAQCGGLAHGASSRPGLRRSSLAFSSGLLAPGGLKMEKIMTHVSLLRVLGASVGAPPDTVSEEGPCAVCFPNGGLTAYWA